MGRKREHFKLGVVFMIVRDENSLFWSRAAAGRQAPAAACDSLRPLSSNPRMGDDSQRIVLRNVTFMMNYKHQQAVSNATMSSHCFKRQDLLAEQRPRGCYLVAHLLSLESDVEVSKFLMGSVKRSKFDSSEISWRRLHTGPGPRLTSPHIEG